MVFLTQVNGIPCQCSVLFYSAPLDMRITGSGMGDCEPPELEEFHYELLDRQGKQADWLERYITPDVEARLLKEFHASRGHRAAKEYVL